jgi:sugar/nucleoside kinase (ribokinase family)
MANVNRITIFELAPCADTLFGISQNADEGYVAVESGEIKIRSGATLRPLLRGAYAGGKATNVARIIDKLLSPDDKVEIELVVFRPDSPEGRYIAELQSNSLKRVRVRSVIVDSTARFCINVSDADRPPSSRVEFNLSPRVQWQSSARQAALAGVSKINTELLLLAGSPPVIEPGCTMAVDLPASIIDLAPGSPLISIDLEKGALARCIDARRHPDVIKINREEFQSVDQAHWDRYKGVLVVTDDDGCDVWDSGPTGAAVRVPAARGHSIYSTVGAGDATHAAFTVARWLWGFDPVQAARYGMAAAAASVSSPDGTHGLTKQAVGDFFRELSAAG